MNLPMSIHLVIEENELSEKYLRVHIAKEKDRLTGELAKVPRFDLAGDTFHFDTEVRLAQYEVQLKQCQYTLGRLRGMRDAGVTEV
jgi:hypothetical protein